MFGKSYNYKDINYRLFCYKGSIYKFKIQFSDKDTNFSKDVSTDSEACQLDRVVGVLLCKAHTKSSLNNAIKTTSFLVNVEKKPWKIGTKVGFQLREEVLMVHSDMFILKVKARLRKPCVARDNGRPVTSFVRIRNVPHERRGARQSQVSARQNRANSSESHLQEGSLRMQLRTVPMQVPEWLSHQNTRRPTNTASPSVSNAKLLGLPEQVTRRQEVSASHQNPRDVTREKSPRRVPRCFESSSRQLCKNTKASSSNCASPPKQKPLKVHEKPVTRNCESPGSSDEGIVAKRCRSGSARSTELLPLHSVEDKIVWREFEKEDTRLRSLAKPITTSVERVSFLAWK